VLEEWSIGFMHGAVSSGHVSRVPIGRRGPHDPKIGRDTLDPHVVVFFIVHFTGSKGEVKTK
jgi:hypothetical protein